MRAIDRTAYDIIPIGIAPTALSSSRTTPRPLEPGYSDELSWWSGRRSGASWFRRAPGTGLQAPDAGEIPSELGEVDVVFPTCMAVWRGRHRSGTVSNSPSDPRYVGSGVSPAVGDGQALKQKVVFAGAGLPVGPQAVVPVTRWRHEREAVRTRSLRLGCRCCQVRPRGYSMGITKVTGPAHLDAAIEAARAQ